MTIIESILSILAIAGVVSAFIFWHLNSIKKVEEKCDTKLDKLSDVCQELKDQLKDLKHKDEMQQMAIDSFKELWPLINDNIKKLNQ